MSDASASAVSNETFSLKQIIKNGPNFLKDQIFTSVKE